MEQKKCPSPYSITHIVKSQRENSQTGRKQQVFIRSLVLILRNKDGLRTEGVVCCTGSPLRKICVICDIGLLA